MPMPVFDRGLLRTQQERKESGTPLETNKDVAPRIRDYLSRNFLFGDGGFNYGDDASFLEMGIVDSFGVVELLAFVQEEFGISVADDELVPDNFDSVSKLSSFIVAKQGAGT
jgi:acyl carrier protein